MAVHTVNARNPTVEIHRMGTKPRSGRVVATFTRNMNRPATTCPRAQARNNLYDGTSHLMYPQNILPLHICLEAIIWTGFGFASSTSFRLSMVESSALSSSTLLSTVKSSALTVTASRGAPALTPPASSANVVACPLSASVADVTSL